MKIYNDFPKKKPSTPLLDSLDDINLLKEFTTQELIQLCDEIREFLLFSTNISGGHFGAGLGVVELTVALHHVFNTPKDKIIWDVGHQAYPHKILTGRKNEIETIRKKGGLAPFPAISESEYDSFGVGHSSTSISASLGLNEASQLLKDGKTVFSVIGDGAMTAGLAFEGLMHAGHLDRDLNIVLNDNDMSISKNKGGLSDYLAKVWASKSYKKLKSSGKKVIKNLPFGLHISRTLKDGLKSAVMPGNLFEDLGMHYIGPIDGHDVKLLVKTLQRMKEKNLLLI